MFKIANQVLDAYDDLTSKIYLSKVATLNPDVSVMSQEEVSGLPDEDFALCVITKKATKLNKFPVNSPDNTWLSNHYFEHTHHKLAEEAATTAAYHIKQACDRFGIPPTPSVEGMAKEASSNVYFEGELKAKAKVEHVNFSKFANVEEIGNNYTVAQYVFATPAHVKTAAKYFDEYHKEMPVDIRHKYAAAIQMRAKELGMPVQKGMVVKYASDSYSAHLDAHLRKRASLLEVAAPEVRSAFDKLAQYKKELPPSQFAQLLRGFDKRAKLDQYYGGYLVDPYQATFAEQPDEYAGYRYKTASKGSLSAEDIRRISVSGYDKVKEYFGKTIADELKKNPVAIFDSLPKDAKEILVGISDGAL